jgi:hypothetical protein
VLRVGGFRSVADLRTGVRASNRDRPPVLERGNASDELQNPDGLHRHPELWNGGTARGLERRFDHEILMGKFVDEHGGGEYGEY